MSDSKPSALDDLLQRMMGMAEQFHVERVQRSWLMADRAECRARLQVVIELSAELERIKAVERFSTALGAGAIEAIIEGDWKMAGYYAEDFTFEGQGTEIRDRYGPLWQRFRDLLQAACAAAHARAAGISTQN